MGWRGGVGLIPLPLLNICQISIFCHSQDFFKVGIKSIKGILVNRVYSSIIVLSMKCDPLLTEWQKFSLNLRVKGSDRQRMVVWECRIVEKLLRIHLRHKRFNDAWLPSYSAKSTFKIIQLGGYVLRINF